MNKIMVTEDNKIASVIRDKVELFNDWDILKHVVSYDEPQSATISHNQHNETQWPAMNQNEPQRATTSNDEPE